MSGSHRRRGSKSDPRRRSLGMTGSAFQVRNVVFRFLCGSKLGRSLRRGSCRDRTSVVALKTTPLEDFYIRST